MGYLLNRYYQKSYSLIYPLLDISSSCSLKPINTYLYWDSEKIDEGKYIVLYNTDAKFKTVETMYITKNPYILSNYCTDRGEVYVFDVSFAIDEVALILEGKYSRLSEESKYKIRYYHKDLTKGELDIKDKPQEGKPFHMILYPKLYYEVVANELGIEERYLRDVGELWEKPDIEKETLVANIIADVPTLQKELKLEL